MIGRVHGQFGFLAVVHVVEFALCDGVHAARHFCDQVCEGGTKRAWTELAGGRWYVDRMFLSFVSACRWLLEPACASSSEWAVLAGEPVSVVKRKADGRLASEFGTKRYMRTHVRAACVRTWEYVAAEDGRERLLDDWLGLVGAGVAAAAWSW
eukprot:3937773-Rhodomonas_salina.1